MVIPFKLFSSYFSWTFMQANDKMRIRTDWALSWSTKTWLRTNLLCPCVVSAAWGCYSMGVNFRWVEGCPGAANLPPPKWWPWPAPSVAALKPGQPSRRGIWRARAPSTRRKSTPMCYSFVKMGPPSSNHDQPHFQLLSTSIWSKPTYATLTHTWDSYSENVIVPVQITHSKYPYIWWW